LPLLKFQPSYLLRSPRRDTSLWFPTVIYTIRWH